MPSCWQGGSTCTSSCYAGWRQGSVDAHLVSERQQLAHMFSCISQNCVPHVLVHNRGRCPWRPEIRGMLRTRYEAVCIEAFQAYHMDAIMFFPRAFSHTVRSACVATYPPPPLPCSPEHSVSGYPTVQDGCRHKTITGGMWEQHLQLHRLSALVAAALPSKANNRDTRM